MREVARFASAEATRCGYPESTQDSRSRGHSRQTLMSRGNDASRELPGQRAQVTMCGDDQRPLAKGPALVTGELT